MWWGFSGMRGSEGVKDAMALQDGITESAMWVNRFRFISTVTP